MSEGKRDAVKRTRPLQKKDSLPIIIGLVAGIVLLAVVLILVWVFVLGKNTDHEDGSSEGASLTETADETGRDLLESESESDSGTETETESESETASESESERESETEDMSGVDPEVTAILDEMSLEEKIDQIFLLTPLALVRANDTDGSAAELTYVDTVGTTTTAAYEAVPVGGVVIGENNKSATSQDIAMLIEDFRELADEVPLLIAMTQTDYEAFTEAGSEFVPDILISGTTANMNNGMELGIELAVSSATADQLIEMLQDGADMILMTEDDFDYSQMRERLVEMVEQGEAVTESEIDRKVTNILSQKLGTASETGEADVTDTAGALDTAGTTGSAGTAGTTGTTGTSNTANTSGTTNTTNGTGASGTSNTANTANAGTSGAEGMSDD